MYWSGSGGSSGFAGATDAGSTIGCCEAATTSAACCFCWAAVDGPPSASFCSSVTYGVSIQQLQGSNYKPVAGRLNWGKSTS